MFVSDLSFDYCSFVNMSICSTVCLSVQLFYGSRREGGGGLSHRCVTQFPFKSWQIGDGGRGSDGPCHLDLHITMFTQFHAERGHPPRDFDLSELIMK